MHGLWAHLVAAGLLHDLLSTSIGTSAAAAVGWKPWRAHRKAQRQAAADRALIADRLDSSTPGGITDLKRD